MVKVRRSALMDAGKQVQHQGDTCEASLYVVPFLVQAALGAPGDREAFVYWLAWSCDPREDADATDLGRLFSLSASSRLRDHHRAASHCFRSGRP